MAIDEKTDLLPKDYTRTQFPILEEGLRRYFQDELQRIEIAIGSLVRSSVQVADDEPLNPQRGMIRYAISPWNPLGTGFTGLVVYDGTSWVAV
jgi:hypothetical protein